MKYKVMSFQPSIAGCGGTDKGWDIERCNQFQNFLNTECGEEWKLHSYEYRTVNAAQGCSSSKGAWLVCIFERI